MSLVLHKLFTAILFCSAIESSALLPASAADYIPPEQIMTPDQPASTPLKQVAPTTSTTQTTAPSNASARITVPQAVLPLPGALDTVQVFNSNSPEIVLSPGVLLSTFPSTNRSHPEAHLNHAMEGQFDVFFHHVTNASKVGAHTLYLGMLASNASDRKVHVKLLNALSYSTTPDSPFIALDAVLDNNRGKIYAGPGDRVALAQIRDKKQSGWHRKITLDPGETKVVYRLPLKNGRTGALRLETDGPVYLASLATNATEKKSGKEKAPELADWMQVLDLPLGQPRDKVPSVPGASGPLIYGRVAGVQTGTRWEGYLATDKDNSKLPLHVGDAISFPVSTISGGTHGTNQVQAAPMLRRYPDTAYASHGNYGVLYDLTVPLYNDSDAPILAGITMQTPLKDWNKSDSLQFFVTPPSRIFYRGTIKFEWIDPKHKKHKQLVHLVQKQGQQEKPLVEIPLQPHEQVNVQCSFVYPADCTPPQVLSVTATAPDQ